MPRRQSPHGTAAPGEPAGDPAPAQGGLPSRPDELVPGGGPGGLRGVPSTAAGRSPRDPPGEPVPGEGGHSGPSGAEFAAGIARGDGVSGFRGGSGGRLRGPASRGVVRALHARGLRLLQMADLVGVLVVLVATNLVRFGEPTAGTEPLWAYGVAYLATAGVHVLVAYFGGLYEPELRLGSRPQLPRIVALALVAAAIVAYLELNFEVYYVPRASLPALPVLTSLVLAWNRRVARSRRLAREGVPRVLLVGAPDDITLARTHLEAVGAPAVVVGETTAGADLLAGVAAAGATDVLLVSARMLDQVYPDPLATFERRGVGVLQRVGAQDTLLGLRGVREVGGMPFVALGTHALPASQARLKRVLELGALVLVAPVLLVVTLAAAAWVRVAAGAPILFRQERVGRDGTVFTMLKFRTMVPGAEQTGPVLAATDDPRVVPACRWLRAARLDELPQLWNVLRGEMSVVGPRPERPELTARYDRLIPGYARRHEIPPGMTGLAQVHGRYHTDPEYKLGHDLQYLVNWSPVLDLQILLRTAWVVLSRRV